MIFKIVYSLIVHLKRIRISSRKTSNKRSMYSVKAINIEKFNTKKIKFKIKFKNIKT